MPTTQANQERIPQVQKVQNGNGPSTSSSSQPHQSCSTPDIVPYISSGKSLQSNGTSHRQTLSDNCDIVLTTSEQHKIQCNGSSGAVPKLRKDQIALESLNGTNGSSTHHQTATLQESVESNGVASSRSSDESTSSGLYLATSVPSSSSVLVSTSLTPSSQVSLSSVSSVSSSSSSTLSVSSSSNGTSSLSSSPHRQNRVRFLEVDGSITSVNNDVTSESHVNSVSDCNQQSSRSTDSFSSCDISTNLEDSCSDAHVSTSGSNPTLWLGDDQMLLLPGSGHSERTDSGSGASSVGGGKSTEGLLSPNGTSILWDEDTDWILLFDNMIRYADINQRTTRSCGCKGSRTEDDTDSKASQFASKAAAKRASSAPPVRRGIFPSSKAVPPSSSGAGGADEEMFMKSFEEVPKISLYNAKELETELTKIKDNLDPSSDWEKRIEQCKRVRSIIIAGGHEYDEFYPHLRLLEHPFQSCVKDLRSQVVREASITIAYLSQQLGQKLDHFAEAVLPSLINLIPNSAKIMSTAGIVAIHFIIRYTHGSRLIPVITSYLSSKSKDIRRTCFEFLDQLLVTWPTYALEKHVGILQDAIRKGISDADPEARAFSRKAFWGFADHFREQADMLLNSLDNSKQRMLHDELTMSNSSSSSSLTQSGKPYRTAISASSVENLSIGRTGTLGRRTGISNLPNANAKPDPSSGIPTRLRSTSAIDLSAVRRAKARAAYSTVASLSRGSGASLPRNTIGRRNDIVVNAITSPERVIKSRPRGSQSQPSSRPDSPSSRLSYATYSANDSAKPNRARNKSGIPIATSREASPTRSGYAQERRLSGSRTRLTGAGEKYPLLTSPAVPLMAERTLQQSREAEVAVADALRAPPRRRYNAFDDQSDESETSSVCSDRSFSSFGRSVDDINEVIHNLHSIHWNDRKEGLQALQAYFRSGRILSTIELKKVTDIFTKIFMDPHTKVFALFLDTLNELIIIHKSDLYLWLYVLLTRLFLKMGADILGSVLAKIQKTLELVKDSFPYENQFFAIMKFLNDQTQTPNTKVKIALLKYLQSLVNEMDPSKFSSANHEVRFAFMKVISWTSMPKSSDLRKYGEDVLASLFSLNPAEYSNLIDQLPTAYKDSAFQLLHSRYPRSNSETPRSAGNRTSPCPVMSHLQSPNSGLPWPRSHGGTPQNRSFEYDDTENLNPEEISNSWKKTMSEIEEYKSDDYFDKGSERIISESPAHRIGSRHSSVDGRIDSLVERLELGSSTDSSPTKRSPTDYNNIGFPRNESSLMFERELAENVSDADNEIDDHKTIFSIVDELNQSSRNEKKMEALKRLVRLTREQSSIISNDDFRIILREVVQTVEDTNVNVRTFALKALCELIKSKADYFQDYVELTLLKILEAHKDTENDVIKMAEYCSAIAAVNLPPEQSVRTLKALILTGQMPVNQAAIRMLSKLVEYHPKQTVLNLLPEVMPALVKAYDNSESAVRKAAVFCMVTIHCNVGDAMKVHLVNLNSCKMKLLNVYIRKAQLNSTSSSAPGSPGNPPSSSGSQ